MVSTLCDSTIPSRSRVVSPVIDVIDWKTFQYHPSKALQRGVLDWKLDFHWEPLPERERNALPSPISPIRWGSSHSLLLLCFLGKDSVAKQLGIESWPHQFSSKLPNLCLGFLISELRVTGLLWRLKESLHEKHRERARHSTLSVIIVIFLREWSPA